MPTISVAQTLLEQLKAIYTGMDPLPPGKIPPTVGLNIGRMHVSRTKLIFWDLGGSRSLRALWEKYYSEAHGLLYVVDASDHDRLEEGRETLRARVQELVGYLDADKSGVMDLDEVKVRGA